MPFEGLPERWLTGNGLSPSIDHFIPDTFFLGPVRDQSPAHEDKLTPPGLGLSYHRDSPAWSHVVTGEVERDLREAEMALNIRIDFADVTTTHGLFVESLFYRYASWVMRVEDSRPS